MAYVAPEKLTLRLSRKGSIRKERIFEIDFLRGIDVILMVLLHFACALYIIKANGFLVWNDDLGSEPAGMSALLNLGAYLFPLISSHQGDLFFLEFFFSMLFVFLSGISTGFAKSNALRGMKLLMVAMGLTLVCEFGSWLIPGFNLHIYCGILHAIALSILLYSFVNWLTKGNTMALFIVAIGVVVATLICSFYGRFYPGDDSWLTAWVKAIDPDFVHRDSYINIDNVYWPTAYRDTTYYAPGKADAWKLLFGLAGTGDDYFSPLQCSAIMFLGAVFGKVFYPKRKSFISSTKGVYGRTLFFVPEWGGYLNVYSSFWTFVLFLMGGRAHHEVTPIEVEKTRAWAAPITFVGSNSLYVYIIHMPAVYLILGGLMLAYGYQFGF